MWCIVNSCVTAYILQGCDVLTGRRTLAGDVQVNKEALEYKNCKLACNIRDYDPSTHLVVFHDVLYGGMSEIVDLVRRESWDCP